MNVMDPGLFWAGGMLGVWDRDGVVVRFRWPEFGGISFEVTPDAAELPATPDQIVSSASIDATDPPTEGALIEQFRLAVGDPLVYMTPATRRSDGADVPTGWTLMEVGGHSVEVQWQLRSPSRPQPIAAGATRADAICGAFALLRPKDG